MRNAVLRLVVAPLLVTLLGCASGGGVVAPRITLQNLEALPSTVGPQRFRAGLLIDNPNPDPILVYNLEFQLRLADQGILDGAYAAAPLTVEALDRRVLTLEIQSELISSLSRLLLFVQGPENALPYELFGRITLDRVRSEPMTFANSGQVPLSMAGER